MYKLEILHIYIISLLVSSYQFLCDGDVFIDGAIFPKEMCQI